MRNCKKSLFIFLLLSLTCLLVACGEPDAMDSNNNPIKFKDYRGKWIVLNYWASWCGPCYKEIPELNQLYEKNKDKLVVLGVNYDQMSAEKMRHFAKKNHVTYPLLTSNPGQHFAIDSISLLPATFLISPQGKLEKSLYGPQTAKKLAAMIEDN